MDKLEQIKETIEGSAELLDKQPEYHFNFDELIRIISDNDRIIKSVKIHEDWPGFEPNPLRYYNGWKLDTDVNNYWDRQYRTANNYWDMQYSTAIRPIYTNTQTTTSGNDAVVASPRHLEEWCDFITDDAIPF